MLFIYGLYKRSGIRSARIRGFVTSTGKAVTRYSECPSLSTINYRFCSAYDGLGVWYYPDEVQGRRVTLSETVCVHLPVDYQRVGKLLNSGK